MERTDEQPTSSEFRLEPMTAEDTTSVVAHGDDPQGVIIAGLRGVLALALGREPSGEGSEATLAAPIEGRGADLAATFAGLAETLLTQIDAFGSGMQGVRLDGLLETDTGGYSAWGYATGREKGEPVSRPVMLSGAVAVSVAESGRIELRAPLRPR